MMTPSFRDNLTASASALLKCKFYRGCVVVFFNPHLFYLSHSFILFFSFYFYFVLYYISSAFFLFLSIPALRILYSIHYRTRFGVKFSHLWVSQKAHAKFRQVLPFWHSVGIELTAEFTEGSLLTACISPCSSAQFQRVMQQQPS